jgi:hypothetical protein
MKFKKLLITCSVATLIVFFSQCKKTTTPPVNTVDPNTASYINMQKHIFQPNCNSSGCHNTAAIINAQHGLVLEGADVYEKLLDVAPKNTNAKNDGLKLVMAGKADSSFLFTKCEWTSFKYGNQMPLGANALSSNEIEFIKQWINAGAPKTGVVADYKLLEK